MIRRSLNRPMVAASASLAWFLLTPMAASAAQPASFFTALDAYQQQDAAGCSTILGNLYRAGEKFPEGGELLLIECTAAAGDHAAAFDYLKDLIPSGRLSMADLRTKERPGLTSLRADPAWPATLQQVVAQETRIAARLDAPLRQELLDREAVDQAAQHGAIAAGGGQAWAQLTPLNERNTTWLKAVIAEKGWPGFSLVGRDGAKAAWLLVQHADHDPAFQAHALSLMEQAAIKNEAEYSDLALLTDRVLLAQGKPQRYGTQFAQDANGILGLRPTEDMEALGALREKAGLPPLDEYKKMLAETYGKPVK